MENPTPTPTPVHWDLKRKKGLTNSPCSSPILRNTQHQQIGEKMRRVSSSSFSTVKNGWTREGLSFYNFNSGSFSNSSGSAKDSNHSNNSSSEFCNNLLHFTSSQTFCPSTCVKPEDLDEPINPGLSRGISLENTLSYGVFESNGKRSEMEDRYEVIPFSSCSDIEGCTSCKNGSCDINKCTNTKISVPLRNTTMTDTEEPQQCNWAFFGIYDGHGGTTCADYVQAHLHDNIVQNPCFCNGDPETAIIEGVKKTDEDYIEKSVREGLDGLIGTTVCGIFIFSNKLYVVNVGDSAAYLYRKNQLVSLTNAHTPANQDEKARIESVGGVTVQNRLGHPVWNAELINLAVSRAIGNVYFKSPLYVQDKQSGLISDPEITKVTLTHEDQFVFLASDGFWDVIRPDEACNYVLNNPGRNPSMICKELTEMALTRSTFDNTTVLLINLNAITQSSPQGVKPN